MSRLPTLLAACSTIAAAAGPALAVTATWNFADLGADAAIGGPAPTMAFHDLDTQNTTTFGTTNGASTIEMAVPDLPDGPSTFLHHPPLPNDGAGGYTLDFAPGTFLANGGGAYVNNYTVVADVFVSALDWTAIFQTSNAHDSDADWYVAPDGAVGIGALGYSSPGAFTAGSWHRIAFVRDGSADSVKYFVDGSEVFAGTSGGLDGRHSLYTSANAGVDFIFQGEGDGSGNYTNEAWISSFMIADYALADSDVAALGGPSAAGIIVPEPSTGVLAVLGVLGFLIRRRRGS